MSGLIKGAAAHSVRPFLAPAEPAPVPVRDPRLEQLERENQELRSALAAQRLESEQSVKAARAEGERQGRAAADDAAVAHWQDRLADLDGLAPSLARAALGKLFEAGPDQIGFVTAVLARQMRLLRRESLVAIRVSARDFKDEAALASLAADAGTGSVRVVADADLAAGECRIDLQLGHIDVGAATQWAQLAAFLDGLAEREGGQ